MKKTIVNSFLLILTSAIWGAAFVAQSSGGDAVGPYTFNCLRLIIGFIVLLPVIRVKEQLTRGRRNGDKRRLITGGVICGIIMCVASNLQQLGITYGTSVGKAGFLTACYIIFVPVLGIFLHKKCAINVWISVVLTVIGLYMLCINEALRPAPSDLLLVLCAIVFSLHILAVDRFGSESDPIKLSCIQFLVSGVLTAIPMYFSDIRQDIAGWAASLSTVRAWIPILYAGVCSCGIAYTLQIVAQPKLNPTAASIIMSLESVFSALAGWVLLRQRLSLKEVMGCVVIFIAVILAQIPVNIVKNTQNNA